MKKQSDILKDLTDTYGWELDTQLAIAQWMIDNNIRFVEIPETYPLVEHPIKEALKDLVDRCDKEVLEDGSNIDTLRAHSALGNL